MCSLLVVYWTLSIWTRSRRECCVCSLHTTWLSMTFRTFLFPHSRPKPMHACVLKLLFTSCWIHYRNDDRRMNQIWLGRNQITKIISIHSTKSQVFFSPSFLSSSSFKRPRGGWINPGSRHYSRSVPVSTPSQNGGWRYCRLVTKSTDYTMCGHGDYYVFDTTLVQKILL